MNNMDLDFGIGDLVWIENKMGVVIMIEEDPEGMNHDISVLCGHDIIQEFHHGVMPV